LGTTAVYTSNSCQYNWTV